MSEPDDIDAAGRAALRQLRLWRDQDAPTHGGRVLSYVYDAGLASLDELAAEAARLVQPLNGLDPTVFTSIARMERDLVAFGGETFGDPAAVGTVTSGGTESCLLAVKAARDDAQVAAGAGSIVLPTTAHAAFVKAAGLFGARVISVPVDPVTTAVRADDIAAAIADDTFLVVASAPNYPTGTLDPIAAIGEVAAARQIAFHVDACLGGLALAWWPEPLEPWDLRVPGVTSLSADLHKYGYAPKGSSLLLHNDRDRHRAQYFALTDWPGYPIVNPTLLGSRSAAGLASAWTIVKALGVEGYAELVGRIARASAALRQGVAAIDGLRIVGDPVGPVFAVAADPVAAEPVHPHRWAAAVATHGFVLQPQPQYRQPDGTDLPATTHLTITPVTEVVAGDLLAAAHEAADGVRGLGPVAAPAPLRQLADVFDNGLLSVQDALAIPSAQAEAVLADAGVDPKADGGELDIAAVLAAIELLPRPVTAKLLTEYLAAFTNP